MPDTDILDQSILNKTRKDKFLLVFTVPECLKTSSTKTERYIEHKSTLRVIPDKLQYSVYGDIVPAVNIPSQDLPYMGQHLKVSSHARAAYDDLTVNFTVDSQYNNYWYIWRWLDIMNDSKQSSYDYLQVGKSQKIRPHMGEVGNKKDTDPPKLILDYATDFTIYGLNEYDKPVVKFTYTKGFPVSLGSIDFNYRDPAEMETTVSFSFSQLHVNLM